MIRRGDIPDWVDGALCAQIDPDLFDTSPEGGTPRVQVAKRMCARCDVLDVCREYAIARPKLDGVWGGTTERERVAIRRDRAAARGEDPDPGPTQNGCGTLAGYKRHIATGTRACDDCKAANAKYQRDRRAGRTPAPAPRARTAEHGTEAGYKAHSRRNEPACAPCTQAMRARSRERAAARRRARASA